MLAASLDQLELVVARRPRVTILCTGDELRAAGSLGRMGMIPESNSPGLSALARQASAEVVVTPLVADEPQALEQALSSGLQYSDLMVTIGGVSVGDHDYARSALQACGVEFDFWKVSIKPGKPVAFARKGACRVLALPGNPASAAATFALFGIPLLRAMQGDARPTPPKCMLTCDEPIRRNKERLTLSLGRAIERDGQSCFTPHSNQSSGATLALAQSDGMALIPAGDGYCDRGASVQFMFWSLL
jgi:molybdopterin molybdotransferase